jgi:hypothetical protein
MDSGFPDFNLAWTIALFKNKKYDLATRKLYTTAFSNTYLIDLIFENKPLRIEKSELINWETLNFAVEIEKYWKRMLTSDFISWLKEITSQEEFKSNMVEYIELQKLLYQENDKNARRRLLDKEKKLFQD